MSRSRLHQAGVWLCVAVSVVLAGISVVAGEYPPASDTAECKGVELLDSSRPVRLDYVLGSFDLVDSRTRLVGKLRAPALLFFIPVPQVATSFCSEPR